MYDLEIEHILSEIKARKVKRVLIQLPDGFKPVAFKLASTLEKNTCAEVLLLGDSCYGACDLAINQAQTLKADLLIHYGHSPMIEETRLPVLYVAGKVNIDVVSTLRHVKPMLRKWKRIGLATTVQHVHQLGEVNNVLKQDGFQVVVGTGKGEILQSGQVLGCDYSTARNISPNVDCFLFIGGGKFHAFGLALATSKPIIALDPFIKSTTLIGEKELKRFAMQRMAKISLAKKAKNFGVIISLKPGQYNLSLARLFQKKLNESGYHSFLICINDITSEKLMNYSEAEAFVNTACPRIAINGVSIKEKPILNINETYILLGEKRWEDIWNTSYLE